MERHGFEYDHHTGSHIIMKRRSDSRMVVIPDKGNRPVPLGTISSIIRQSGIPRSEFE